MFILTFDASYDAAKAALSAANVDAARYTLKGGSLAYGSIYEPCKLYTSVDAIATYARLRFDCAVETRIDPKFMECGCCGAMHFGFTGNSAGSFIAGGDCRDDTYRFDYEEMVAAYDGDVTGAKIYDDDDEEEFAEA